MSTRTVLIPPFVDPLGNGQGVNVRFALVDTHGRPVTGYTDTNGIVTAEAVPVGAAGATADLVPNAEISPATYWRVTVEHSQVQTPPQDCTLVAAVDPIDLRVLLQVGVSPCS